MSTLDYEQQYDMILRVIVVGDSTVGKSSLIQAFATNSTPDTKYYQEPTIGVDFYSKLVFVKPNLCVKLQIWDTAGQEKFRCLTSAYYRNSVAALILYDMTQRSTFDNLPAWYEEVRQNIGYSSGVLQLVACKADLEDERTVTREEGQLFATERNLSFFETSAVSKTNVDQLFDHMATEICAKLERGEIVFNQKCDGIRLTNMPSPKLSHVEGLRQLYLVTESWEDFDQPEQRSSGYGWLRFGRRRQANTPVSPALDSSDSSGGGWFVYRGCC